MCVVPSVIINNNSAVSHCSCLVAIVPPRCNLKRDSKISVFVNIYISEVQPEWPVRDPLCPMGLANLFMLFIKLIFKKKKKDSIS